MSSLKNGNEPAKGGLLVMSLPLVGSFPYQGSIPIRVALVTPLVEEPRHVDIVIRGFEVFQ